MQWRNLVVISLVLSVSAFAAPKGKLLDEVAKAKMKMKMEEREVEHGRMLKPIGGLPKGLFPDTLLYTSFDVDDWNVEDLTADNVKGWHLTDRDAHSGTYSFWCGDEATGQYGEYWVRTITFGPFDLSTASNPYLRFYHKFDRDWYAYGDVYASTDNVNWDRLTYYDSDITDWTEENISLSDYKGESQVWIRFIFFNNSTYTAEGWYLDDISIVDVQTSDFFSEDFESGDWPPTGWNVYKEGDASSNGWQQESSSTTGDNGSPMGDYSAWHNDDNVSTSCDDWLVSPQIDLTGVSSPSLVFYERNYYMSYYEYHGVWISTGSGDPADGDFVELQEMDASVYNWTMRTIDLSDYVGQQIYIAFRYQGDYATEWYIDEVRVSEITEDTLFFDDFESGDDNVTYGTGVVWTWVDNAKQAETAYFSSDPSLPHYPQGTYTSLYPPVTLDLSGYEEPELYFRAKGGTADDDKLKIYWYSELEEQEHYLTYLSLESGTDWEWYYVDLSDYLDDVGYPVFKFYSDYDDDVDTGVFISEVLITAKYRQADYVRMETPVDTVRAGETAEFTSWIYESGVTEAPGATDGLTVRAYYGDEGTVPEGKAWIESVAASYLTDTEIVFFYDDFDDGDLDGWTVIDGNNDNYQWEWSNHFYWYSPPWDYGVGYAMYDDDAAGEGAPANEELISPSISLENYDPIDPLVLSYDWCFKSYDGDDTLFTYIRTYSAKGWSDWQQIAVHPNEIFFIVSGHPTIDISAYVADSIQVKFVYIDYGGWNYAPMIDNVKISAGYPRECYTAQFTPTTTGTYDVAFAYSFNAGTPAEHWAWADLNGNDLGSGGSNGYDPEYAAKMVVLPGEHVGDLEISDVPEEIIAGTPVECTVMVYDEFGNFKYDFNGWVDIGLCSGNPLLGPEKADTIDSVKVVNGVWIGELRPITAIGSDAIIVWYGDVTDTTNWFKVVHAEVDTFVIDEIKNQLVKVPFKMKAEAYDAYGNFVDDFDGEVYVDDGTGTLHSGKLDTFKFHNGVLDISVVIDSPMVNDSIVVVYMPSKGGEPVIGVSNKFTVVPNVVDYVRIIRPEADTVELGEYADVYFVVYEFRKTALPGPYYGIVAEVGIGEDGTDPSSGKNWSWFVAKYLKDTIITAVVNGDTLTMRCDFYMGRVAAPDTGLWDVAARATFVQDTVWIYGDLDGNAMGLGDTNWYSPDQAMSLKATDNWIDHIVLMTSDTFEVRSGESTPYIYGQVMEAGYTNRFSASANIEVQFGYGEGDDPSEWPDTNWFTGAFFANNGAADVYRASIPVDADSGEYHYTVRARFVVRSKAGDYEGPWIYGDLNGEPDTATGYEGFGLIRVLTEHPDTNAPEWARLVYPRSMVLPTNTMTRVVIGRVYKADADTGSIVAQVGYGSVANDPESWTEWSDAAYYREVRMRYGDTTVTAYEYRGSFMTPSSSGVYYYGYRFNYDGSAWLYGDLDGSDNGFNRPGYLYVYSWGVLAMPRNVEADVTAEGVVLRWDEPELAMNRGEAKVAADEIDSPDDLVFDHYEVYASDAEDGVYELIGETEEPVFVDRDASGGYRWYYVVAVYNGGNVESPSDGVLGVDLSKPTRFEVSMVRPNPVRDRAVIRFAIPAATDVEIDVYDASGRVVRMERLRFDAGIHEWSWDLRNGEGLRVGAGVYFVRIDAGGKSLVRQVVVMR